MVSHIDVLLGVCPLWRAVCLVSLGIGGGMGQLLAGGRFGWRRSAGLAGRVGLCLIALRLRRLANWSPLFTRSGWVRVTTGK